MEHAGRCLHPARRRLRPPRWLHTSIPSVVGPDSIPIMTWGAALRLVVLQSRPRHASSGGKKCFQQGCRCCRVVVLPLLVGGATNEDRQCYHQRWEMLQEVAAMLQRAAAVLPARRPCYRRCCQDRDASIVSRWCYHQWEVLLLGGGAGAANWSRCAAGEVTRRPCRTSSL
jgi:hypothetical protein